MPEVAVKMSTAPSASKRTISGMSHHFFSCLQKPKNSFNNAHMLEASLTFKVQSSKFKVQGSNAMSNMMSNMLAFDARSCYLTSNIMNEEPVVWAFDLGKGSIGEAVRQGTNFLHKASLLIPPDFAENKKGAAKAPVQELRSLASLLSSRQFEILTTAGFDL
jgi:hypothetical protein